MVSWVGVQAYLGCCRSVLSRRNSLTKFSFLVHEPGLNLQNPVLPVQVQVQASAEPGSVVRVQVLVKSVHTRTSPDRGQSMLHGLNLLSLRLVHLRRIHLRHPLLSDEPLLRPMPPIMQMPMRCGLVTRNISNGI